MRVLPTSIRLARRTADDARGVSTVEFALWLILIFMALVPCLDSAAYLVLASRLSSAVQQASAVAYNARDQDLINTAQLASYVGATAALPNSPAVTTVDCNGGQVCVTTKVARRCVCVGWTGTTATYSASASCGAPCPSGATSGYYLRIATAYTYRSLIVRNPWLDGTTMRKSVTVRLQ